MPSPKKPHTNRPHPKRSQAPMPAAERASTDADDRVPLPDEPEWLDHPDDIADLADDLGSSPWICLDTEFLRERTYWPQLCLIQIAAPDLLACVDPLAVDPPALDPLWQQLSAPDRTVVMHAARQDLEIMDHSSGRLPDRLFDTQVAATLLGIGDQMGYGALVEALLGVVIPKSQSRTDWTRRPLSEKAIRYAADDVRHLARMYPILRDRLAERDRLAWAEDACDAMLDPRGWRIEPDEAWRKVKGARKLKGEQAAVARVVAAWRERTALEEDRPRKWILSDDAIVDLARNQPTNGDELSRMRSLKGAAKGAPLLDLVRKGLRTPPPDREPRAPRLDTSGDHPAVADALAAIVRWLGLREGISPGSLATRSELEAIAAGRSVDEVLDGWRVDLLAGPLEGFLAGGLTLGMHGDRLELMPEARDGARPGDDTKRAGRPQHPRRKRIR